MTEGSREVVGTWGFIQIIILQNFFKRDLPSKPRPPRPFFDFLGALAIISILNFFLSRQQR